MKKVKTFAKKSGEYTLIAGTTVVVVGGAFVCMFAQNAWEEGKKSSKPEPFHVK